MIIIMILTSLILGIIFVILFIIITNNNKFEDYEPFSIRILIED
ncbi:cbb3-type cytochrome oxidase assembly protein CcoS [Candidatus Karelsulcia muelleri]|uniref:Cbb3-type cytochrome oxidase assembly protein CcoS n=1 Tax=Candidatus Karelsulcia muelleri TaxID=336810 RepID=A0A3A1MRQ4_9FLAO|nr:cbb3-type cytochrome oxidase assembly protein CcoS [Candidatus Karelsulcia muelleri]RIU86206.1 cbb3-type cytochrome oxidase assembly protein CcoS [Candidatus Karelsulcia muelleri]